MVTQHVLVAIEPASLQLSLQATDEIQHERDRVHAQWKRRLATAATEANRLRKQYDTVEPANRLVAIELERRWEEALCEERRLRDDYDRFLQDQPDALTQADVLTVEELAASIPRLWNQSPRHSADQKQIVRHLIERVVLDIKGKSEHATMTIRWQGGFESQHGVVRSVARYDSLTNFDRLQERIEQLWRSGRSTKAIAAALNVEGFRTPTAGKKYTRHTVRKLLDSWGLTEPRRGQIAAELAALGTNEWWLMDLSQRLGVDRSTMQRWCRRGWVHARQMPGQRRWWIVWADQEECDRLRRLYQLGRGWLRHNRSPYPAELKTPKDKPATNESLAPCFRQWQAVSRYPSRI